jgi:hypothetical protein
MSFDPVRGSMQPFREAKTKGPRGPARQIYQTVVFDLTLELGDVFLHVHVYESEIDEHDRPLLPGQ